MPAATRKQLARVQKWIELTKQFKAMYPGWGVTEFRFVGPRIKFDRKEYYSIDPFIQLFNQEIKQYDPYISAGTSGLEIWIARVPANL
jgi:hypothetical protein